MKNFYTYDEASLWAQEQKITSAKEWRMKRKSWANNRVPVNPDQIYPDFGARGGWGSFLNTGRIAHKDYVWLPYTEASAWMKANNILTPSDLKNHPDRPNNIPSCPQKVYKEEFAANGGWSAYVGKVSLNNTSIIERLIRLVLDTVFDPTALSHRKQVVDGGSGARHQVDMAYPSCRLIVEYDGAYFHANKTQLDRRKTQDLRDANWRVVRIRERGLEKVDEVWDVVVNPGSANQKIQTVAAHLNHLCQTGLLAFSVHKQQKLAAIAQRVEMGVLLEKMALHQGFASYEAASQWGVAQGITSAKQWYTQSNRPSNMPSAPNQTYPDFLERGGWSAFLRTHNVRMHKKEFVDYLTASQWAHDNNVTTQKDWNALAAVRPANIPSNPNQAYPNEFEKYGWRGFVDASHRSETWATYEQAASWARAHNITGKGSWGKADRPINMPAVPNAFYQEFDQNGGWEGFCNPKAKINTMHPKR